MALIFFFLFSCGWKPPSGNQNEDSVLKICFEAECMEKMLLTLIQNAHEKIELALYGFEGNPGLTEALIQAKKRKVNLEIVSDFDSEIQDGFQSLILEKMKNLPGEGIISLRFGNTNAIMHNKYMIVDSKWVLTGSTNWTDGIQTHFNHMILLKNPLLAKEYQKDFKKMFQEGLFSTDKDNDGVIPDWVIGTYQTGIYPVQVFFTPYKDFYPETFYDDPDTPAVDPNEITVQNAFSEILPLVSQAKKRIMIFAFSFTDRLLMETLFNLHQNQNIEIKIWLDQSQYQSNYNSAGRRIEKLKQAGIQIKITQKPDGLLHHKMIAIDDQVLIIGSLNFSNNAVTSNDENFLILKNASSLIDEFEKEAARIDEYSNDLVIRNEGESE
ncbi:MAG: hypothetical protein A2Y41_05495 [Spirochaetes bacterium GWB1_36_13]|nr:MAG: hypothetical protein A2Y41_05495 [Spirochaetes bacterium GWB1_36_13]